MSSEEYQGGGFVIHQDMKNAMTRQQQAYAAPAVSQPTGNPVYNATHDTQGNVLASAQQSSIVNAPVSAASPVPSQQASDFWVNPATKSFETATAQASSTPAPPPASSSGSPMLQPSTFWTDLSIKPVVSNPANNELKIPVGQELVPNSIKVLPTGTVEYYTQPKNVALSDAPVVNENFLDILGNQFTDYNFIGRKSLQSNIKQGQADPTRFVIEGGIKVAGLLSLGAAPAVAAVGAVVSPLITQGIKGVSGGELLTKEELSSAVFGGAAFSVIGAGANQALGLTGAGIKAAAGRVGVNAALGAGAGSLYEYAETKQITGLGAVEGAAFGAGLGLAGEVSRPIIGKLETRLPIKTTEYNVKRLTGAKEIERSIINPDLIKSERLTTLQTTTEKVPKDYGKFLLKNQNKFIAKEIDLAGTEKVAMVGGDEFVTYEKAYQSTRNAEPYLNALKRQNSLNAKGLFADNFSGQRVSVSVAKMPKTVYTETRITGKDVIGPEKILTRRNLTGVKLYGDIDSQVYLNYLKNVPEEFRQDWLKQMGGLSAAQLQNPKVVPKNVRAYTDIVGVSQKVKPLGLSKLVVPVAPPRLTRKVTPSVNVVEVPTMEKQLKRAETNVFDVFATTKQRQSLGLPQMLKPASASKTGMSALLSPLAGTAMSQKTMQSQGLGQSTRLTNMLDFPASVPNRFKPNFGFPGLGGKYEGSGPSMFFGAGIVSKRSLVRKYPVLDPKKLLGL